MAAPVDPRMAEVLLKILASDEGKDLFKGFGVDLTADDVNNLTELVNNATDPVNNATDDDINKILVGKPSDYIVHGVTSGISNGLNAGADISENNVNRLAAALLKSNRVNTDRQDSLYGQTYQDKMNGAVAENRLRKGENRATALRALGDTVKEVGDSYTRARDTAKSMQAARAMGNTPGAMYYWLNGTMSRAQKVAKAKKGGNSK